MEAIKYDPQMHYQEICQWHLDRSLSAPLHSILPSTGRVVRGKCAAFLYKTDSALGFIENFIAKPGDYEDMQQAFNLCLDALEKDAKESGIKYLWGGSFLPSVIHQAKEHGFIVRPERYQMVMKEVA